MLDEQNWAVISGEWADFLFDSEGETVRGSAGADWKKKKRQNAPSWCDDRSGQVYMKVFLRSETRRFVSLWTSTKAYTWDAWWTTRAIAKIRGWLERKRISPVPFREGRSVAKAQWGLSGWNVASRWVLELQSRSFRTFPPRFKDGPDQDECEWRNFFEIWSCWVLHRCDLNGK